MSSFRQDVRLRTGVAVIAAAACCSSAVGQDALQDLVQRSLPDANTLVLLKVDDVLRSRVGIEEGWGANLRSAAAQDAIVVPPNASLMLVTGQVDFEAQDVHSATAVFKTRDPASIAAVAKQKGRELETIAGLSGFRTTWDSYALQFDEQTFGILAPADRQQAARWGALGARRAASPVSSYLEKAVAFAEVPTTHIVMSIDLSNTVPASVVEARLKADKKEGLIDFDNVAEVAAWVSSVQGATLRLSMQDKIVGQLRIDFGEQVPVTADQAKPVILRALSRAGMELPEMADWQPRSSDMSLALQGDLSVDSLSLLMGLVAMPYEAVHVAPGNPSSVETTESPLTEEEKMAAATKEHFDAVQANLRRLRLRRSDAKSFGQAATWIASTASRLGGLPVLNVDQDMLAYTADVSDELRQMSLAYKNVGIQTGYRSAQYNSGYYYQDTAYGRYYNSYDASADRRRVGQEERAMGAQTAEQIASDIQGQTAEIRVKMSQRYQMEF